MNKSLKIGNTALAKFGGCAIFLTLLQQGNSVHAHMDPGSGSRLLQVLIATLAAAGGAVSVCWETIKSLSKNIALSEKKKKPIFLTRENESGDLIEFLQHYGFATLILLREAGVTGASIQQFIHK